MQKSTFEQAAGGIGLQVNMKKMEYMCFNREGDISTLNGGSLQSVDKYTYLGNSVSFTENDINMRLANVQTAIEWLERERVREILASSIT